MWAASYNMLWNRVYVSSNQALFIGPSRKPRKRCMLDVAKHVYVAAEKVRSTRHLLRCSLMHNGTCLQVDRPFSFKSSVHLFADQYEQVHAGDSLAAYSVSFSNLRITVSAASGVGMIMADVDSKSCSKMFDLNKRAQQNKSIGAGDDHPRVGDQNQGIGIQGEVEGEADDDDEDQDYGIHLLRDEVASCNDTDVQNVSALAAAAASMAEAAGASDGALDGAAVRDMIDHVASHVDEDLDLMFRVEQDVLHKAVASNNIAVEELQPRVDQFCREGMEDADAVFEAALNSSNLLGNMSGSSGTEALESTGSRGAGLPTSSSDAASQAAATDMDISFPMSVDQRSEACYLTYCSAFSESIRALLQCLHACSNARPSGSGLSLAYSPEDIAGQPTFASSRRVILISWDKPGSTGRVARVDAQGRLVSMVCVGHNRSSRNFAACKMIHPDIGVAMERVRKKERTEIPKYVLRVAQMFLQAENMHVNETVENFRQIDVAQGSAHTWRDVACAGDECVFCGNIERHARGERPSLAQQCPLCLLAWHEECSNRFALQHEPKLEKLHLHPVPETQAAPELH